MKFRFPWLGALALGVAIALVSTVSLRLFVDPVLPPRGAAGGQATGWVKDDEAVRSVLATLARPSFGQAAPVLVAMADQTKDALLYTACQKVTGKHLPAHDQNPVGCCVSEGYSSAVEYLQCVDIATGAAREYQTISHSYIYGTSRVDVGKGQIRPSPRNPHGDGSVGAWAAKAVQQFGVVTCAEAGESNDGPHFAREWGARGVPAKLKEIGARRPVRTASQVKSADEALAALQNGYPVAVCFSTGFSRTRDSEGFCRAQGQWGHCQAVVGYRADKRGFCFLQSWGANVPSGPLAKGQPDCSFWVTWSTMDAICREGDTFALSSFEGFPGREIDWIVRAPTPARLRFALADRLRFALAP